MAAGGGAVNLYDADRAREELDRALRSGHAETVARVTMSNIWPLYSSHYEMLITAVESLPSPLLERYPVLRVLHRMTPVLARTTRPFKPLVYPDIARTMSPDELDVLTLIQMIAFRISGDVAAALIYARRLEDRIIQTFVESRERTDGPLWFYHHQIGSTLLAAGNSTRALLEFATARQLGRISNQHDAERMSLGREALAHSLRGSLDDADRALAAIEGQPAPTAAHVNSTMATERTAAAVIGVERMADDIDGLLSALEPYDSIELTWPFALLARVRAFLARQQPDHALEVIRLASEAHPAQHGSFASDVITSGSIEALLALGDVPRARRIADGNTRTGLLIRLASVRLALHEGRFDAAAHEIGLLAGDHTLGPAQRAESSLLSVWLELARTGRLDSATAGHACRVAVTGSTRRLFSTMPRQLVEEVRARLPIESVTTFDSALSGLSHVEIHPRPVLTGGELRVLAALTRHGTTAAVASALHVSPNTIKSQLKSLYRKLGCSRREDAIKIASRLHLLARELDELS